MKKKSPFSILAVLTAAVLAFSSQGMLAFGQETGASSYTGYVTEHHENSETETEDSGTEESSVPNSGEEGESSAPVSSEESTETEPSEESSGPESSEETSDSEPSQEPSKTESAEESSENPVQPPVRPFVGGTSSQSNSNPVSGNSFQSGSEGVGNAPDFSDEDNHELVDDGSVITGLPVDEESGESDESEESSKESSNSSEEDRKPSSNGGSNWLLILGIAFIVLGVAGLGTVIYLQFIRPKMKNHAEAVPPCEEEASGNENGVDDQISSSDHAETEIYSGAVISDQDSGADTADQDEKETESQQE